MSYILDALRKSERQRRLGNIPSLESEPRTVSRPRALFRWLAAGVLLAAVVLAGWWWMLQRDSATPRVGTAPAQPASGTFTGLGAPAAEPHAVPRAPSARTPAPAPSRSPAAVPAPEIGREPPPSPQPPVARTGAAPARSAMPPAAETLTAPTPYARLDPELRAQLPPLTVNAVSFSEDVGRRFVMINETIYREGQEVAGVTITQILRDGVVLSYRGREFLLPP